MRIVLYASFVATVALLPGCGAASAHHRGGEVSHDDKRIEEVAEAHGAAGPWAVAGYRMGEYAIHHLGLTRGSLALEVVHYTPHEVQYACIADGAAASTGASVGKLNLTLADAMPSKTRTLYRRRGTGQTIILRVTSAFVNRFRNVPPDRLGAAGEEVMSLRDEDIFEVVP